ncbi:MAG: sigma 54-interacting transcriptional regulator [Candidatus Hydrogenedentes bacterium]|nr:sigma 54-interacting transcriptional regulator [Candidatus Hydrogenedentota bacterium]
MESTSDNRFDPWFAAGLLIDVASEQSLENLFQRFVRRGAQLVDFVQVWLIDKGDRCETCPYRAICADQTRCLHLVAAEGRSALGPATGPRPFENLNTRVPLGAGSIGESAVTNVPIFGKVSDTPTASLVGTQWMLQEGVQEYLVGPIRFKGEVLGISAGFVRGKWPEDYHPWGQVFSDQLGAAIANAQAFQEIHRLKAQLELQNSYLEEAVIEAKAFGDLVGQSAPLRHIVSQIDLVAPTEASVLILGETGTGKELVAHEIHRRSGRKEGPLVRVNCASIPRELFESEFFGHVKGSFTGALKDRAGRFETADGGTIFLDEVAEIPIDIQNKLLRVLQEKRYERVGDDRTRRADVRIIAATNRDLKQAVAAGRFREDLYYRLNVFPIHVPPLRERLDDVPALAKHFVELSSRDLKCAQPRLSRTSVTKLQSYDWPGNVRELRNVIERAVILARGGTLDFDLPISDQPALPVLSAADHPDDESQPEFLTEVELRRRERDNLRIILEKTNWKIKGPDGAAELLGVNPTTLLSRMDKWGLKRHPS